MDARVSNFVVTPRRGKSVEINALWYNALRLMEELMGKRGASPKFYG
jgi:glycogen debranching enzyme